MAVTPTPALPQTPRHYGVQVTTGTGSSTLVTLATGGTNGTKITSVLASNSDSTANTVTFGITSSATFYPLGASSIAATAGVSSIAPVSFLSSAVFPVDNDGQPYFFLTSSADSLQVKGAAVPSSAGSALLFIAFGADF